MSPFPSVFHENLRGSAALFTVVRESRAEQALATHSLGIYKESIKGIWENKVGIACSQNSL